MNAKALSEEATFTALHFFKATTRVESICQIAIEQFVDFSPRSYYSALIQPPNNYYDNVTSDFHHIYPITTENAPKFIHVWPRIVSKIADRNLLMRNKYAFAELEEALRFYGFPLPNLKFIDAEEMYRSKFTNLTTTYTTRLKNNDIKSWLNSFVDLYFRSR